MGKYTLKWKYLFYSLLILNIVTLAIVLNYIYKPVDDEIRSSLLHKSIDKNKVVSFPIQTNKSDINKIIQHYLMDEFSKGNLTYDVVLAENSLELFGSIPLFSRNIEMRLSFAPAALENGNVVLTLRSMTIGQIQLPSSFVLKVVKEKYHFPGWVYIQPSKEKIYVALDQLKLKSNLKVKAERIDFSNDDIQFILTVPLD